MDTSPSRLSNTHTNGATSYDNRLRQNGAPL
jgi:hypothetical protein